MYLELDSSAPKEVQRRPLLWLLRALGHSARIVEHDMMLGGVQRHFSYIHLMGFSVTEQLECGNIDFYIKYEQEWGSWRNMKLAKQNVDAKIYYFERPGDPDELEVEKYMAILIEDGMTVEAVLNRYHETVMFYQDYLDGNLWKYAADPLYKWDQKYLGWVYEHLPSGTEINDCGEGIISTENAVEHIDYMEERNRMELLSPTSG